MTANFARRVPVLAVFVLGVAGAFATATNEPPRAPNNESIMSAPAEREARTPWWREARFGMFVHWGMSSIAGTEISW